MDEMFATISSQDLSKMQGVRALRRAEVRYQFGLLSVLQGLHFGTRCLVDDDS